MSQTLGILKPTARQVYKKQKLDILQENFMKVTRLKSMEQATKNEDI